MPVYLIDYSLCSRCFTRLPLENCVCDDCADFQRDEEDTDLSEFAKVTHEPYTCFQVRGSDHGIPSISLSASK